MQAIKTFAFGLSQRKFELFKHQVGGQSYRSDSLQITANSCFLNFKAGRLAKENRKSIFLEFTYGCRVHSNFSNKVKGISARTLRSVETLPNGENYPWVRRDYLLYSDSEQRMIQSLYLVPNIGFNVNKMVKGNMYRLFADFGESLTRIFHSKHSEMSYGQRVEARLGVAVLFGMRKQ